MMMRLIVATLISTTAVSLYAQRSDSLAIAVSISGLRFTPSEIDSMRTEVWDMRQDYQSNRSINVDNSMGPAFVFNPLPNGFQFPDGPDAVVIPDVPTIRPNNVDDLAFMSIGQLGYLLRTRQVSSEELTSFFLTRLKEHDPELHCVVTLIEQPAMAYAREMDDEIREGSYRGALHGIPYGIKDLFATRGAPTTWGAAPYQDQHLETDAHVVKKLQESGAVLIAKLSLGALAWGDVWFGGKTRNPWNSEQGSSGSSAGSASATAAGLVPFTIGTETLGSIVSPSTTCGTSGLRPTFGRIGRSGAMALSWTMDKIGPICRSATDCAIVFEALEGTDPDDPTSVDLPFGFTRSASPKSMKIGYVPAEFDAPHRFRSQDSVTLELLRQNGFQLVPIALPVYPSITFILQAEAAAAFDELTRSNRDDELTRQIRNAWPNVFRAARTIPAVEYINAMRLRTKLINEMAVIYDTVDAIIHPSLASPMLRITNMTGHPTVVIPNGFRNGTPTSISITGRLYEEGAILELANWIQSNTTWHLEIPEGY